MPDLEFQLGDLLRARNWTLATAESCTGGLIASRITDVAGSSDYFVGGIVSYANSVKMSALGVSQSTLETFGAVSRETVIEMARGARKVLNANIAVSVSGIAGPGGGTADKPVGTTWLGLSTSEGDWARKFVWDGDRIQNKKLSTDAALQFIIDYLNGKLE